MYVHMLAWKLIALAITVNNYHNRRIGNLKKEHVEFQRTTW
jgi:hypothetical protein